VLRSNEHRLAVALRLNPHVDTTETGVKGTVHGVSRSKIASLAYEVVHTVAASDTERSVLATVKVDKTAA
jgi:hypothetical protein